MCFSLPVKSIMLTTNVWNIQPENKKLTASAQ